MKSAWLLAPLALFFTCEAYAANPTFVQGVNYVSISPAQPTDVKPGQIEVIEFFWYGCPHCFRVEPSLEAWLKSKPKDVVFRRIPGAMPGSEFYTDAQAFYTAQVLGIGAKIHEPLFNAIHLKGNVALASDKGALRIFFGKYGVSAQDFDAAWDSFTVHTRMAEAAQVEGRYGINGVPTFVIDGKWMTGAGYGMPETEIMNCVDYLVRKDRAAMK